MPAVQKLPEPEDQSLHRDPRHPGQGRDAGRHLALQPQGQADLPLHGLLDVFELHRAAGDRGGEDPRGRAVRQELLHRLRRDDGRRRRGQHRQGDAGLQRRRVRPRRHRAQRHPGREDGGRRQDRRRRHQRRQGGMGPPLRHDPFRQPDQGQWRHRPASGRADRRRRRLHVRLHRQYQRDAAGARSLPPRLGRLGHHRGRGSPARKSPHGRSSSSPAGSGRARRSAARAAAPTCRKSSTGT